MPTKTCPRQLRAISVGYRLEDQCGTQWEMELFLETNPRVAVTRIRTNAARHTIHFKCDPQEALKRGIEKTAHEWMQWFLDDDREAHKGVKPK